jgi:hypothetical protein
LDDALDLGLMLIPAQLVAIQVLNEVELNTLRLGIEQWILDVGKLFRGSPAARPASPAVPSNLRALINCGKKSAPEIDGGTGTAQHAKPRKIGILGPQSVECPRPHGRAHKLKTPRMGLHGRLAVIRLITVHAAQQAKIIGVDADIREETGNPEPTLSMPGKLPG